MKKPRWALTVDTFEPNGTLGPDVPVVTHIFRGPTKAFCEGSYRAHLRSDRFIRECTLEGSFEMEGGSSFRCNSILTWRKLK